MTIRCPMCLRSGSVVIPRAPEAWPASRLLGWAPLGQALHGILWLCWRVLPKDIKRNRIVRLIFSDRGGLLHDFAEYLDLGPELTPKHRAWLMESMQHEAEMLERILAREDAEREG